MQNMENNKCQHKHIYKLIGLETYACHACKAVLTDEQKRLHDQQNLKLDRWVLKRNLQGLLGPVIGMTDENEDKQLTTLIRDLGKIQKDVTDYLQNKHKK